MDMLKVVDDLMAKMFGDEPSKPEEKEVSGVTDPMEFLNIEEEDEDE